MNSRSKVADEQTSSLGGWLFADLFLLIMVIGLAGFTIIPDKNAPKVVTGEAREAFGIVLLTGIVDSGDEDTTAYFRWGTNSGLSGDVQATSAEESPVDAGRSGVTINAQLEDLKPGTTYYFQAKVESKAGSDTGEIRSFKTAVPAEPPTKQLSQAIEPKARQQPHARPFLGPAWGFQQRLKGVTRSPRLPGASRVAAPFRS